MKRNVERRYRRTRTSTDTATQTEQLRTNEDISRFPVVLLDKSVITSYIQKHGIRDKTDADENDENVSRNIERIITTTNYSTFLKPITNNEYANSTFDSNKRTASTPAIKKKSRRKVKFFKPKRLRTTRKPSTDEEVEDLPRLSPIQDTSCDSVGLQRREKPAEMREMDVSVPELEEVNDEVQPIELGSLNVRERSLNAENQDFVNHIEESVVNHPLNSARNNCSTKATSTESTECTRSDVKFDCVIINSNTVNIYNHFYGRGNTNR